MKLAIATILLGSAAAFAPVAKPSFGVVALNAAAPTTGPQGSAAATAEEDLELTRQVIFAHMKGDDEPADEEPKEE
eukprot:CAMPEP_0197232632 /NCGR_PEP_ID=MMETSP1429-20130617/887_1 /TAXON_ID=49237 /ORGANISM="Chaetoceros  sp., Strain UNC1202" /LENGTH=75 /DNA_ID=CAMNT_0042690715 /DNA_START=94 /DNA_END=321 /DNA_ORIENTATION=-